VAGGDAIVAGVAVERGGDGNVGRVVVGDALDDIVAGAAVDEEWAAVEVSDGDFVVAAAAVDDHARTGVGAFVNDVIAVAAADGDGGDEEAHGLADGQLVVAAAAVDDHASRDHRIFAEEAAVDHNSRVSRRYIRVGADFDMIGAAGAGDNKDSLVVVGCGDGEQLSGFERFDHHGRSPPPG